jgi:hypothetical protein
MELLTEVIAYVKGRALLVVVPNVCWRWRRACRDLRAVHFDFRWCVSPIPPGALQRCRQMFPNIGAVTFSVNNRVTDADIPALGGVTTASLYDCRNLTSQGILQLATTSPNLALLGLDWCNLTDETGSSVAACINLEVVSFYQCNRLTDKTIIALTLGCPKLKKFNLAGCHRLTDNSGVALAKHGVRYLQLEGCSFTDATLHALGLYCNELKTIALDNNEQITDVGLDKLGAGCKQLTSISLEGCIKVTDAGVQCIAINSGRNLKHINVDGVQRLKASTVVLMCAHNRNLTSLDLTDQPLLTDDAIVNGVGSFLTDVTSLLVGGAFQLTDMSLVAVGRFKNLAVFTGAGCVDFTDAGVMALATECVLLTSVNFDHCHKLTDASLAVLATNCSGLTHFSVSGCYLVTNAIMTELALLRKLWLVCVADCPDIDDAGILVLSGCTTLQDVDFAGTKFLTDAPLIALSVANPGLTNINVSNHPRVTDTTIEAFCKSKCLLEFRAAGCHALTDVSGTALAKNVLLHTVDLTGCTGLTHDGIVAIAEACPGMAEFKVVGCRCTHDTQAQVEAACPDVEYEGPFF